MNTFAWLLLFVDTTIILEVQIQNYVVSACISNRRMHIKVFIFLKFGGPKYKFFWVKICTKHPFKIINTGKITNMKFELKNYFIFTPEKAQLYGFWRKTQEKFLFSCSASDSTLKTIHKQMLFCSVLLKLHQKSYWLPKTSFWTFLKINNFFSHQKY